MPTNPMNHLTGAGARIVADRMGEAATNFLDSLTADQKEKTVGDFTDQELRTRWNYTPGRRFGLPLDQMERNQFKLAHKLVTTGLSRSGYATATSIIGLETLLDAIEGWGWSAPSLDASRHAGKYYVSFYGHPHPNEPWGWQFEGHHISLNYTIVDGRIISPTPTFFGANPAETELSSVGKLRPLTGVEDLARELLRALDEQQRVSAILSPAPPPDVVLSNRPQVVEGAIPIPGLQVMGLPPTEKLLKDFEEEKRGLGLTDELLQLMCYTHAPKGLPASSMQMTQQEMLLALIKEYIHRMPEEIAEIELAKLNHAGLDGIHFAWAGSAERRRPHYYRLQGLQFLVEYDNTQNDANHIHSVWRDPNNDFGSQLLAQHYNVAH